MEEASDDGAASLREENARLREELQTLRRACTCGAAGSAPEDSSDGDQGGDDHLLSTHDAFISNLSHELRTPMHALLGALYLLMDTGMTIEQLRHLELITSSSSLLQSLIVDLLDFSAVHTGHVQLSPAPALILEFVEAVVPMCHFKARHKGVSLCYWVEPRVLTHKYNVDSARVEQILLHLLSNAIKFTPAEGTVSVTIEPEGGGAAEGEHAAARLGGFAIVVSDTGRGMSEADVRALHQPLFRAWKRKPSDQDGLGVGLSVVWRLVAAMRGSITCSSVLGAGSSFRVSLPQRSAVGPPVTTVDNPMSLTADVRDRLARAHIMVVSRDGGNAYVWARLLRLYGARVHVVQGYTEAQQYATEQSVAIDIIVLDGYDHLLTRACHSAPVANPTTVAELPDLRELSNVVRTQVAPICRLLIVFVQERFHPLDPESRQVPVSLLSLVARIYGDRIACSLRPIPGESLNMAPVFEGSLKSMCNQDVPAEGAGRVLLTAELIKPFNHRPFLCKVASQLQRLPSTSSATAGAGQPLPVVAASTTATACAGHMPPVVVSSASSSVTLPPSSSPAPSPPLPADQLTPRAESVFRSPQLAPRQSLLDARIGSLRILLVEDTAVNRKLMTMFLRKLGCTEVLVACDGSECLDILRGQGEWPARARTQCILMDISMDTMDGRECTRHIRSELQYQHVEPHVFIIAQTANCTTADRASYLQCGMDDYLPKPISMRALTAALLRAHQHVYS